MVELLYDDEEQKEKEMLKQALSKTMKPKSEEPNESLTVEDELRKEIEEAQFNALKKKISA